jgi:DNA-binding TFAR19-related protein (PDSD5 family)
MAREGEHAVEPGTLALRRVLYESAAHKRLFELRSERPELAPQLDAIAGSLIELLDDAARCLRQQ